MAGTFAILSALARVVVRDLRSLGSLAGNNFFIFSFLLLSQSGPFVLLILSLVLLAPMSADPLWKVPRERLGSWPLTSRQRVLLQVGAVALSPVVWIVAALIVWTARPWLGLQFAVLLVVMQLAGLLTASLRARAPSLRIFRWIPAFPGVFGGLLRKDLRELLSVLDPYPAILLSISGILYRTLAANPEVEARFGLTLLAVLSMSTSAQCLFALDGPAGMTRYRLLPVPGWMVLAAKGSAFAAITLLICLPLAPGAGLAAAFAALAVGNHVSVTRPFSQPRWRFTGGSLGVGIFQVIAMFSAATLAHRTSVWAIPACALLWAASTAWYGTRLEE
jgi:hypothetical protein